MSLYTLDNSIKKIDVTIYFLAILTTILCVSCNGNGSKSESTPTRQSEHSVQTMGNQVVFKNNDTVITCITEQNLINKIDSYTTKWKVGEDMIDAQYIEIIKLYNTISWNDGTLENEKFKNFYNLVRTEILSVAIHKLNARLSTGMGYYSKKYDLRIGGSMNSNSYFTIRDDNNCR